MKIYFGANINGWKVYGIWIKQKYYFGFSIVLKEKKNDLQKRNKSKKD